MELNTSVLFQNKYFSNTIEDYVLTVCLFSFLIIFFYVIKLLFLNKLKNLFRKSNFYADDFVFEAIERNITLIVIILLSLNIVILRLTIPSYIILLVHWAGVSIVGYYVSRFIRDMIKYVIDKQITKMKLEGRKNETSILKTVQKILLGGVWVLLGLVILQTIGVNVSALIAGLGVGGIAVALALKSILEDMFASVSLYYDKPFRIGDFIKVGDDTGSVLRIGLQTTRIRSMRGQILSIPNRELTRSRILNYSNVKKRRVAITFGITYETPIMKIKRIKGMVRDLLGNIEGVVFKRAVLNDLGDFSINFDVVFYVDKSLGYTKYIEIKEDFIIKLMEAFERDDIEFAYPTQKVFVSK